MTMSHLPQNTQWVDSSGVSTGGREEEEEGGAPVPASNQSGAGCCSVITQSWGILQDINFIQYLNCNWLQVHNMSLWSTHSWFQVVHELGLVSLTELDWGGGGRERGSCFLYVVWIITSTRLQPYLSWKNMLVQAWSGMNWAWIYLEWELKESP